MGWLCWCRGYVLRVYGVAGVLGVSACVYDWLPQTCSISCWQTNDAVHLHPGFRGNFNRPPSQPAACLQMLELPYVDKPGWLNADVDNH